MDTGVERDKYHPLETAISEVAAGKPVCFSETSSLGEVFKKMQTEGLEGVIVESESRPVGLVTKKSFFRPDFFKDKAESTWTEWPVSQVMDTRFPNISSEATLGECIKAMNFGDTQVLPVCNEEGKIQSIVNAYDLLLLLKEKIFGKDSTCEELFDQNVIDKKKRWQLANEFILYAPLKNVIFEECLRVDYKTNLEHGLQLMWENPRNHLLLVEYNTQLRGVFTLKDFWDKILGQNNPTVYLLGCDHCMTPWTKLFLAKGNVAHAIVYMATHRSQNVIAVDEDNFPLALVGPLDILKFVNGPSVSV